MIATGRRRGFTLIELIAVMAVLATVLALAAPTLSGFIRGRSLQEEARRFLALSRYGRSQAVSCSVPMELWIDPESGDYGLSPAAGYELKDDKPIEWSLKDGLIFEMDHQAVRGEGRAIILFQPDGSIDPDSLDRLSIRRGEEEAFEIRQAVDGLGYIIQDRETEIR